MNSTYHTPESWKEVHILLIPKQKGNILRSIIIFLYVQVDGKTSEQPITLVG